MFNDGLLSFGDYHGQRAWFVQDQKEGCIRRLDGEPWQANVKCRSCHGKEGKSTSGWPIGVLLTNAAGDVVLCEGGPDMIAAYAVREFLRATFAVVCLLGADLNIHEGALPHFKGKRVRIVAHNDDPGKAFAERNGRLLTPIAERVEIVSLAGLEAANGKPAEDLCDILAFIKPWKLPDEVAGLFTFGTKSPRVRLVESQPSLFTNGTQDRTQDGTQEDTGRHNRRGGGEF